MCPERSMASLVVLGVYMMISNIILLNMLIALFSNTYDEIKGNSKIIWAGIRYETMIGGIHVLPFGPLNGIVQVFLIASVPHSIVFYLFKCLFCCQKLTLSGIKGRVLKNFNLKIFEKKLL